MTPAGSKWTHPVPFLATLGALLASWGVPLHIFMHFYEVLVNTCDFLLKINGNSRKNQEIAVKIADFT